MFEFTMYSIGSGQFLREVFNGLAMITGTGDFVKAVMIGMLFATIVVCVQAVLKGGREIAWQNILLGWILYACFFAVPSRVIVEDIYDHNVYTVDNVPLGASAAGSMISKVGYGLTELLETGYGTADRVTQLPYMSSLKYLMMAMQDSTSARTMDALAEQTKIHVRASLGAYFRNCAIPAIINRNCLKGKSPASAPVKDIIQCGSDDEINGTALYYTDESRPAEPTCKEAYEVISSVIVPALSNENMSNIFNRALNDIHNPDGVSDVTTISNIFTLMDLSSQNQQDFMLATVIKPILNYAYGRYMTKNETMANIMVAQAIQQRNVQWAAEQSMWVTVAQPLMTFFEGFTFAITPFIAMLLCMGGFGFTLIGKYIQTLFWINLWMPIMSICNLYTTIAMEGKLNTIDFGTIDGIDRAAQAIQSQIATGGMLMTATPMLALMIVTGSTYAFTTLASRLNGGDHINEKIVAPDAASVGTVFEQQAYANANRGRASLITGMQPRFAKIDLSSSADKQVSSTFTKMQTADSDFRATISQNMAITKALMKQKGFQEQLTKQLVEKGIVSTKADAEAVTTSLVQGATKHSGGAGFSFLHMVKAAVESSHSSNLSDTAKASLVKSVAETAEDSLAKTATSTSVASLQEGLNKTNMKQVAESASNKLAQQKAYQAASSYAAKVGRGTAMYSNEFGKMVADNWTRAGVQESFGNLLSSLDRQAVTARAAQMESMGVTPLVAQAAAVAEFAADPSNTRLTNGLVNLAEACGVQGEQMGNPYAYGGIPSPSSPTEVLGKMPGDGSQFESAVSLEANQQPGTRSGRDVGGVYEGQKRAIDTKRDQGANKELRDTPPGSGLGTKAGRHAENYPDA